MLGWVAVGMEGAKPEMPAAGYTWAATPLRNRAVHARYKAMPLEDVRARFDRADAEVTALIERHTDAEVFTRRRYPWTGSTSLGAHFVSATSSHYDLAPTLIRKGLK